MRVICEAEDAAANEEIQCSVQAYGSTDKNASDEPSRQYTDCLAIDGPCRLDQFMVARCVVRELAGLCAQQSYMARPDVTES
jgi:hypothetical protein